MPGVALTNTTYAQAAQSAQSAASNDSRFTRIAAQLQQSQPALAQEFALAALDELAQAYQAEASLARTELQVSRTQSAATDVAPTKAPDADLAGWADAVDRYAAQLSLVREDIELGLPVRLGLDRRGVLAMTVAGRTVIIAHPRPDHQALLEQAVLGRACDGGRCTRLLADSGVGSAAREPIPVSVGVVKPRWTFTADSMLCSYQNIRVHFGAAASLSAVRPLCTQLLAELQVLAQEVAWQQRHGVAIDWQRLSISAIPGKTRHRVGLNPAGDIILASLPLLYSTPGLQQQVMPWLRARAAGERDSGLDLLASEFGWGDESR